MTVAASPTTRDEAALFTSVAREIVAIADAHIMPRHRTLRDAEIMIKSRDEVVTAVDREVEERLIAALTALDPGARMVGEESVEAGTATIDDLDVGRLWLIDPLDGTANFASGDGLFGVMVALVENGAARAAWLYDPVGRVMSTAIRGQGSYTNGQRVRVGAGRVERPIASVAGQFMPARDREQVTAALADRMALRPIPRCAAAHYPMLASGEHDLAIFQRTLPWDHAPGALFLTEAGGYVARWDGTPYGPAAAGVGIVAARSRAVGEAAARDLRPILQQIGAAGLT